MADIVKLLINGILEDCARILKYLQENWSRARNEQLFWSACTLVQQLAGIVFFHFRDLLEERLAALTSCLEQQLQQQQEQHATAQLPAATGAALDPQARKGTTLFLIGVSNAHIRTRTHTRTHTYPRNAGPFLRCMTICSPILLCTDLLKHMACIFKDLDDPFTHSHTIHECQHPSFMQHCKLHCIQTRKAPHHTGHGPAPFTPPAASAASAAAKSRRRELFAETAAG